MTSYESSALRTETAADVAYTLASASLLVGPETWWVYYPSASGGNQSPIDIITEEVTYDPDLWNHPLQICYRNEVVEDDEDESSPSVPVKEAMSLVNTGNTARINVINSHSCQYTCKPLVLSDMTVWFGMSLYLVL